MILILIIHIIFGIFTSINALPEKKCNRLKIGDQWHEREVLWANIGRPYNINVHKASNTIFFSYTVPESFLDVDFQLAYYNIHSREFENIVGIKSGCAVTIDQANDEIYLGGSDGIYKYNVVTKLADFYKEKHKNVWSLFYKRHLFYISYPDQKLHIEVDGKFGTVKEFELFEIDSFHITNTNEIYFANKTGFYKYNNSKAEVETINELITVRQIVDDNEGELYICSNSGVYTIGDEGLKKILDMRNVYGLSFDRDNNIIYSDDKSINRLNYSEHGCLDLKHW